jgi:hypothetical protein
MLWILPGFFALFGLPAVLFPRFLAENYSPISRFQPEEVLQARTNTFRMLGLLFLVTAAVFAALILTGILS